MGKPFWCEGCCDARATRPLFTDAGDTAWYCADCADYLETFQPLIVAKQAHAALEQERARLAEWGTIGQRNRINSPP